MAMPPAATPMAMPPPAGGAAPTGGVGGGAPAAPLSPYSSVLPPGGTPGTPTATSGTPGPVSGASSAAGASGTGAPGFVPLSDAHPTRRVSRDVSMSDLELARAAVADLAAAASVSYPLLQFAVAVARGSSGVPEMWCATNEGNAYVPAGVYLPRAMALAGHGDPDFAARWLGWSHPAETAVRAIIERGDVVSAVATSWPHPSELVREATPDVAVGVRASGPPDSAAAATLTRNRSHRLETIDAALFQDLARAEETTVDSFALLLTQEAIAGTDTDDLPPIAESVARELLSRRWPTSEDWTALRSEYDNAMMMASTQRPGLFGAESAEQSAIYRGEFALCRRLEVLLCWQHGNLPDVIYAARCAGARTALATLSASARTG